MFFFSLLLSLNRICWSLLCRSKKSYSSFLLQLQTIPLCGSTVLSLLVSFWWQWIVSSLLLIQIVLRCIYPFIFLQASLWDGFLEVELLHQSVNACAILQILAMPLTERIAFCITTCSVQEGWFFPPNFVYKSLDYSQYDRGKILYQCYFFSFNSYLTSESICNVVLVSGVPVWF